MINTSGFGVNVMPTYSPVDPSLVALDPNKFGEGLMSAKQLQEAYLKLKAYRDQLDEQNALKAKRMQATEANYDAQIAQDQGIVGVAPKRFHNEGLQLDVDAGLIPKKGSLAGARLDTEIKNQPLASALDTTNLELGLSNAKNAQTLAQFNQKIALTEAQGGAARAQATEKLKDTQTQAAQIVSQLAIDNGTLEGHLRAIQLQDQITNAKTDQDVSRALAQAKIDLAKGEANKANAEAAYALGLGRPSGTVKSAVDQISKIDTAIKNLDNLRVSDGRTLAAYIAATRDENGNLKTMGAIRGMLPGNTVGQPSSPIDRTAENYISQRNALLHEMNRIATEGKFNPEAGDIGIDTAITKTPAGNTVVTKQPVAVTPVAPAVKRIIYKRGPDGLIHPYDENGQPLNAGTK